LVENAQGEPNSIRKFVIRGIVTELVSQTNKELYFDKLGSEK